MTQGTMAKHVSDHLIGGRWTPGRPLNENVSEFNLRCLAGMIETGEVTVSAIHEVGGQELMAAVYQRVDHMAIQPAKGNR